MFVVKGLAWHHWKVLIASDTPIDVLALTANGEKLFQRFRAMRAAQRVRHDEGSGTISYEAAQGVDSPQVSVWEFSIYGGVKMAGDPAAPEQTACKIGVVVCPKPVFDEAEKKAMWLRGRPNNLPPVRKGPLASS